GVHRGTEEVRLLGGGAGDDRVPDAVRGDEEDGLGQRGRVRRAVGGGRAVRVGPGPDRVRQRERHDRLDQGRVVGGGPDRTGCALRGADRGDLADVQVTVEDAGRDAVLGDEVVRGGIGLVAAARVGQGRGGVG